MTWNGLPMRICVVPLHLRRLHLLGGFHLGECDLLGAADAHDQLHVGGQQLLDRLIEPLVGDRGRRTAIARLLEDILFDGAPGDALRKRRHAENPHFRFRRPGQPRLTVFLDPGDVFGFDAHHPNQEHGAWSKPDKILGL